MGKPCGGGRDRRTRMTGEDDESGRPGWVAVARRENAAAPLRSAADGFLLAAAGGYVVLRASARICLSREKARADGDGFTLVLEDGGDRRIRCRDFVSVPALRLLRLRLTAGPLGFLFCFFLTI